MTYCINPECQHHYNSPKQEQCEACGTTLLIKGRYRLLKPLRKIDERNSTDIFEVVDGENRKVMKILNSRSRQLIELIEREADALQYLKHSGIPKVELDGYFTFLPNNSKRELHCLVMEKIQGENLEDWIKQNGCISQRTALNWLKKLLKILEYLHQNGILHRDIKPSNIMLKPDGQLVLIDFGSIREMTNTYMAKIGGGLELTSIVSGGYTALEQFNGKALPQSDFYALGRTFVYLLTSQEPGELPETSTGKLVWRNKAPQISQALAEFIDELMAPLAGERPKNTAEILPYLNSNGLLIKSFFRFTNSSKFKLTARVFLILGVAVFFGYHLTKPWQAAYYSNLGHKAIQADQLVVARKSLEKAIELNPNDAIARNDLGLVCNEQKDFECADKQYQQALKLTRNNEIIANIHYNLGGSYKDRQDYKAAIREYQIAMRDGGEVGIDATNEYARLQILDERNYLLAIQEILKALDKPDSIDKISYSNLYKNLGWAYLQQRQYDLAKKYLDDAIKIDKDISDQRAAPHCLLAQLLQETNDNIIKVKESWRNCLKFPSGNLLEVKAWQLEAQRYISGEGK